MTTVGVGIAQIERVLDAIGREGNAGGIERVTVREATKLLGGSRAMLAFFDASGNLESITRYAVGVIVDEQVVLAADEAFLYQAYIEDEPIRRQCDDSSPLAALAVPCRLNGQVVGALGVVFPASAPRITPEATTALALVGSLSAMALENVRLTDYIQQGLRQSEDLAERWLGIVASAPSDMVVVANRNGGIVDVNQVACRTLGYTRHELLHRNIADLVPSPSGREDRGLLAALIEEMIGGRLTRFESALITKTGRVFPVEVHVRPVEIDGEWFIVSAQRDVGERKRAEAQLVQANRLRVLGEMAAGIVHDVNNMLTVALGPIDLLLNQTTDPKMRNLLVPVHRALLDGAQTMRRIQAFARQHGDTAQVPVDLDQLVHDVVELTRPRWQTQAQQMGVVWQVEAHTAPTPSVLGDPVELRELLINLVGNALDAMPEGGKLVIDVESLDTTARIKVTDSGVGMPPEVVQRIFDPFFTTKGARGSGLGLSMVYGIVARHNGEITVDSVPGQGTTFTVRIPIAADQMSQVAAARSPVPTAKPEPAEQAITVIILDDQPDVAEVLQMMLEAEGHEVEVCTSGEEVLSRLEEEPVDLLCTDLNMPGLSGWDVAAAVKQRWPTLPIAVVTGWSEHYSTAELQQRSVDLLLRKPFQVRDVRDMLRQYDALRRR
ncbi:MAG: response regulator [Chloroflexi bacterium]|nr:response regulator [Chloroflexota bacterium]